MLEETWRYEVTFAVDAVGPTSEADLLLKVVDTVADVYLNGRHLAHLASSHRCKHPDRRGLPCIHVDRQGVPYAYALVGTTA